MSRSGGRAAGSWSGPAPSRAPGRACGGLPGPLTDSVVLTGIRLSEGDLTVSDIFGKLEASVDQGGLLVENFSGAVDVTVGTGDADVEVLDLREEDTITITSRRGDIVLRLESGVGAIVEADAPRGRVRSDFDLGVELPAATVKGWIGEGGPNIILRAPNGRVEIVKIKATARTLPRAPGGKAKPWTTCGSKMSGTGIPKRRRKASGASRRPCSPSWPPLRPYIISCS